MRRILKVCLGVVISLPSFGQVLFSNEITDADPSSGNPYTNGQEVVVNITATGIGRGSGITPASANNRYNASGWNSPSLDLSDYFEFVISPVSGANIDFASLEYSGQRSGTGPLSFAFRSSLDGYATDIGLPNSTGTTINLSAAGYQGVTGPITFRLYAWGASSSGGTFSVNDFEFKGAVSASDPKYYRSKGSGDWSSPATWESSSDNVTFSNTLLVPGASEKTITVQSGHSVNITNAISVDELRVNGELQLSDGGSVTLKNGPGNDMTVKANGKFQILSSASYSSAFIPETGATLNVESEGTVEIGNGSTVGSGYEELATSTQNEWKSSSKLTWNSTLPFPLGSNVVYFPNAGATTVPEFLITLAPSSMSGTGTIVNGKFVVNHDLVINTTSSTKIFRDGLGGNAMLTLSSTGGSYQVTGAAPIIDGNLTLVLNKSVSFPNGITIPAAANINIIGSAANNMIKNSTFLVNGTVDIHETNIQNTNGNVVINGILKTSNPNGFWGSGGTVINGALQLGGSSTIEFNASGNQIIQFAGMPDVFKNITFSGSGNKTPSNAFTPVGTLKITGDAILNAVHNIGDGTNATDFQMDGGRLKLSTSGTQPMMNGTFNLTGGVVEFAYSGATAQTIRSPKSYYQVEVTGNNVGNSSGNITLTDGGAFTVKTGGVFSINADAITGPTGTQTVIVENGGTFETGNNEGFHGFVSTVSNYSSIHQNIENIVLATGSTVNYTRAGDQPLTNYNNLIYQSLILSGAGNKIAPAGTLTVRGNLTKSGSPVFSSNKGTVLLDGSNQTFAGLTYNNLILTNGQKTTNGSLTITDSIKVNAGSGLIISDGDKITLHSDASKTGRVANVEGSITYGSAAAFVVERFIPSKKSWRFLAVPVQPGPTIKNSWQEGATIPNADPNPGHGIQITSNLASWAANGFDGYSPYGPSMKTYNPLTDSYVGVTSTNDVFDPDLGGYMTFVRGDRTVTDPATSPTPTTLRMTGKINTGTVQTVNVPSGRIIPINNPFASAIDLRKLRAANDIYYYIFDPNLGGGFGYGVFQTMVWDGLDFQLIPGSGSYGSVNNFVANGQAFFAGSLGPNLTLTIDESITAPHSFPKTPFIALAPDSRLRVNLRHGEQGNRLADGLLLQFDDEYDRSTDKFDGKKFGNFSETFSVKNDNTLLVVDRRPLPAGGDTIFFNIEHLQAKNYQLEFFPANISGNVPVLEDLYVKRRHPVDPVNRTTYDFEVTNDPASANPARFILTYAAGSSLPVVFTDIEAHTVFDGVQIIWHVGEQGNNRYYSIERSEDGLNFKTVGSVEESGLNTNAYIFTDREELSNIAFYRIVAINLTGGKVYSNIVKVEIDHPGNGITVTAVPGNSGDVTIYFNGAPYGRYILELFNTTGKKLTSRSCVVSAEDVSFQLQTHQSQGIYFLRLRLPDGKAVTRKIALL